MLSFKPITIATGLLLLLGIAGGWQWPSISLLVFAYTILLAWGSYRVDSQFYMPTICEGDTTGKKIALTFDDGPDPAHTPALLNLLKEQDVKAAFFCIGHKFQGNESLLRRTDAEGHMIGNHSYSHASLFDFYGAGRIQKELEKVNDSLQSIIGKRPRFFRPPYGVTTPNLARAVRRTGMKAIGWNIRSLDTVATDEQRLFERLMRSLQPGAIFLFHDSMPITQNLLPDLIQAARELGFEWVRLDELINEAAYE
jgi:peptidoglycan/xylan/chitin deacetylase (PgdA/CDA1 family)